ncbi:MAG: ATP-binding cassette domain-containing protein [Anaerolineae bacterium]|jgi:energy-coupling factor transporter ATP-binding protein EcfA2
MIQIEELTVRYGQHQALDNVSLHVEPGEFVLLTGPSGCGKSTLARCLNGLIPHAIPAELSGQIIVDGRVTTHCSVAELATTVGLVFQNPATQLFNLTVAEEVAFGPRNLGLDEGEVARRVEWALEATGIGSLRDRSISTLSGGEQQRLAIAAVLAMGPHVLVLDEPTSSLDVRGMHEVMATLARLNAEAGVTILVIEHRLGEVTRLASRTVILDQGRVVADGATGNIFDQRELLRHLGLRRPSDELQEDWADLLHPNGRPSAPPIVELRDVAAGYGSTMVLRSLDLTLHAGEFTALVGDNGAGKSTLARVLAGLLKPRRGEVRLGNGQRLAPGCDVGLLFQNPLHQLFCDTVEEEVSFGPSNFGCFDTAGLESLLRATDLNDLRHQPVHALSSGQQQRTALAAVLALRPQLVILDEPTMGQDWRHLSTFMDFLVELNQAGCTILLITHDYKLVHRYAQRILLLRSGRIVADGTPVRSGIRESGIGESETA